MLAKRVLQITLIVAVLAAFLAAPRSASAAGACGNYYVVQPGDWLIKIAERCGVSLSALYAANPGVAWQRYIYPGQVLNIPDSGSGGPLPLPPTWTCCPGQRLRSAILPIRKYPAGSRRDGLPLVSKHHRDAPGGRQLLPGRG